MIKRVASRILPILLSLLILAGCGSSPSPSQELSKPALSSDTKTEDKATLAEKETPSSHEPNEVAQPAATKSEDNAAAQPQKIETPGTNPTEPAVLPAPSSSPSSSVSSPVPSPSPTSAVIEPASTPQPPQQESKDVIIYITKTGEKYHVDGCRYLAKSKIQTTLQQAKAGGLGPCSVCNPPR